MNNKKILDDKYEIQNVQLGVGGFAAVYLGNMVNSETKIAIKIISNEKIKKISSEMLELEIQIMKKLDHLNIVKYINDIRDDMQWYIILEFCNAGTLENIIKYNVKMSTNINFNREGNTFYYLDQLKDALAYIRGFGYVHRDIKPINVLLSTIDNSQIFYPKTELEKIYQSRKITVKLADFGLAKNYEDDGEKTLMHTFCGSPLYMAPEQFVTDGYNSKTDLWAYGTIMYQMMYGTHFNEANTREQVIYNVLSGNIKINLHKNFSQQCHDLIARLLDKNPKNRIEWVDFFEHSWFKIWKNQNLDTSILIQSTNHRIKQSDPIKIVNTDHNASPINYPLSPLGYSNLSKMKMVNIYKHNYPASYPLNNDNSDKKRNFLKKKSTIITDNFNNSLQIKPDSCDFYNIFGTLSNSQKIKSEINESNSWMYKNESSFK